jgi:hypothetical protein
LAALPVIVGVALIYIVLHGRNSASIPNITPISPV